MMSSGMFRFVLAANATIQIHRGNAFVTAVVSGAWLNKETGCKSPHRTDAVSV